MDSAAVRDVSEAAELELELTLKLPDKVGCGPLMEMEYTGRL